MAEDFVPAAGLPKLTRLYDRAVALTTFERLLRSGMVTGVMETVAHLDRPRILEVGCGTGELTIDLALALPQAEVTGVDIDPEVLRLAQEKPEAGRAEWLQGSATALPFEPESFDAVAISLVMHHLMPEQQPQALSEAREVLRPGGALQIIDFGRPGGILPRIGSPALALLDGRRNTKPILSGRLPQLIEQAGFEGCTLLHRFGTPVGTLERHVAFRSGRAPGGAGVTRAG